MPYVAAALLIGVVSVLWSVWLGWCGSRRAVWFGGVGTVLTVLSLLLGSRGGTTRPTTLRSRTCSRR